MPVPLLSELRVDTDLMRRITLLQYNLKNLAMAPCPVTSTEEMMQYMQEVACAAMGVAAEMYGALGGMSDHKRDASEVYERTFYNFRESFNFAFDKAKEELGGAA